MWAEAERIQPRPLTNRGRLVIAAVAAAILVIGQMTGRYDTALIGLGLGAAESTLRPAYHRRLVERIRQFGHRSVDYVGSLDRGVDAVVRAAGEGDVVLTLGAGSVTQAAEKILDRLREVEAPRGGCD